MTCDPIQDAISDPIQIQNPAGFNADIECDNLGFLPLAMLEH